ncbi:MAG: hypothetical protein KDE47_34715 [Caldilineaceae bacterium]|nr:hypothetical protein [Caldilineaceae bacterium]
MYLSTTEIHHLTYAAEAHEREQIALKIDGPEQPTADFYEMERLVTQMSVPPLPVRTMAAFCGDIEMMDSISIWVVEEL